MAEKFLRRKKPEAGCDLGTELLTEAVQRVTPDLVRFNTPLPEPMIDHAKNVSATLTPTLLADSLAGRPSEDVGRLQIRPRLGKLIVQFIRDPDDPKSTAFGFEV